MDVIEQLKNIIDKFRPKVFINIDILKDSITIWVEEDKGSVVIRGVTKNGLEYRFETDRELTRLRLFIVRLTAVEYEVSSSGRE